MTVSIPGLPGPPPAPVQPMRVRTPSGQHIEVLGPAEKTFYEGQAKKYLTENKFTNTSDLLDLDRLVFLEMLIYRSSSWLGRGSNYDGLPLSDRAEADQRKALKENSDLVSKVKTDLGLTKSQRDKAQYESVGTYLTELKQRAKEFGVNREKQLAKGITLCQQLFAIVGAFDRADAVEREKIGFEDEAAVLDWVREVMRPEFDEVDAHFRAKQQRYWVRKI